MDNGTGQQGKWEYLSVGVPVDKIGSKGHLEAFSVMGQESWELVTAVPRSDQYFFFFKRREQLLKIVKELPEAHDAG